MKQLTEKGAKNERYERHQKRHWHYRRDPNQLELPFKHGSRK